MERTIAEAIIAASRRLAPVTLGVGTGQVDFTVNRRVRTAAGTVMRANPVGLADRRVRVLRLDPADAPAPPGTLGGHAVAVGRSGRHPVFLRYSRRRAARRELSLQRRVSGGGAAHGCRHV